LDFIIGGNYNKDSMALNSQSLGETTSSAFINELKRDNLFDVFSKADQTLENMITVEIRIATGSKTDVPTGNIDAKNIANIVNKHRENARIKHFIMLFPFTGLEKYTFASIE
jgi:hypothetical protein